MDFSRRHAVKAAEQIQQRGFAGAGVAHNDGKIPFINIEIDVSDRMELFRPGAVGSAEIACPDEGNFHFFGQADHSRFVSYAFIVGRGY